VITREQIVDAIQQRLQPLDYVQSFFEAGSVSFGNDDELSDMDLVVDADEGRAAEVFAEVEAALTSLANFDRVWRVPEPAWHGYSQRFYHLAGTPDYLYIDFLVRADGKPKRLNEVELHGTPRVYFDKSGVVVTTSFDITGLEEKLATRVESIRGSLPMLAAFVRKEIRRGNAADAMAYYQTGVLRPLVELLRIRHSPLRHNFGLRYLVQDIGEENAERLCRLSYAADMQKLGERNTEAEAWARELLDQDAAE
jgi:predicted nucleotidyltransferase